MRARLTTIFAFYVVGLGSAVMAQEPPKPRLAVLIVFDQMRGDYLERWYELFGDGGFRRLLNDGAWFQNCHFPDAMTATGPGHASMSTGCSPQTHGIVGNQWYERTAGASVNCATFLRFERLPPELKAPVVAPAKDKDAKKDTSDEESKIAGFGAPVRLLAPTVADVLRESAPKSKIVGLSLKDRSALLPVGRRPDACYWFHKGQFVTSTYYTDRLHPWVAKYNDGRSADRWFGAKWEKLKPDLDYAKYSGPDDGPGESTGKKQGKTFPHPYGTADKIGLEYYDALATSPFGNQILLELACKAIESEHLGQDDTPDLLTISFSSNDLVGHVWGPDSQEVLDITLRSDLIVRDLLNFLDAHVGKDRYVIVLTADHGICPLPEKAKADGKDAGRQTPSEVLAAMEAHLRNEFAETPDAKTRWIDAANEAGIYLNQRLIAAHKLDKMAVARNLAAWLERQPFVHKAFVRDDLIGKPLSDDPLVRRVQKISHRERSGDVGFVLKPYYLISTYKTGTTHGTPHPYDTHVPLVVFGTGVKPGKRGDAVTPQACAAILAKALGVNPPAKAEAPVPASLFSR